MALEKESLINFLPDGFETLNQEGYKENFSADKIATGYEKDVKDRVTGPNLNNLIDVIGKNTNTLNNYVEYLNNMPIGSVPIVNDNNNLDYQDIGQLSNKADKNLANTGMITNCLLEVPQRIKLELNNGTLTLKAGSKVIVPNGFEADGTTPKFDYVTIESDVVKNNFTGTQVVFLILNSNGTFNYYNTSQSGSTAPTAIYTLWYDTGNNIVKSTNATTDITSSNCSLPLAKITITNNVVTSIDQIFNGMGYIGSAKWIDKGVKMLCSDGKNEDGTYNNVEYTTPILRLYSGGIAQTTYNDFYNIADTYLVTVAISQEKYTFDVNSLSEISIEEHVYATAYVRPENRFYVHQENTTDWKPMVACKIGTHTNLDKNGNVGSFNPKQPFRAIDYSDKPEVSGWGMPSSKYIDLTLGASGTTYTAPAKWWVVLCKRATASAQEVELIALPIGQGVRYRNTSASGNFLLMVSLPVKKGQQFVVGYTADGETAQFTFIYADGEV